jgi:anti-anti-sigma factor
MDFSLNARAVDRETLVSVAGELDLASAGQLWDCLAAMLRAGSSRVFVDLARVTFMDCAALGVLLRARQASVVRGGELCLIAPPRPVQTLLALTGTQWLAGSLGLPSATAAG